MNDMTDGRPAAEPVLDPVAPPQPEQHRIEFHGTGGEYFRIWIVNLALSVLTLGIYSAWAKVRRLKYFYGNTTLAGHAFDYHGRPVAILKGRLLAVALLVVYLGIGQVAPMLAPLTLLVLWALIPWIVTRARMFQSRMTSYRGVRFDFEPDYKGALRAFLLAPFVAVLSFGLAAPWATRLKYRWLVDNSAYGRTYFSLDAGLKPYVKAVLVAGGLVVGGMFLVVMLAGVIAGFQLRALNLDPADPDHAQMIGLATVMVMYPMAFLLMYLVAGLWQGMMLNATLPATTLGPARLECRLSAGRLAWIYASNLVAIVLTLGVFTPWARVRAARYVLGSIGYTSAAPIDGFLAAEQETTPAAGEEIGDLFDVDFGF